MSKLTLTEGAAAATPSAGKFNIYFDSADSKLKYKSSAGTVVVLGDIADAILKTIVDAKGDLIAATAADVVARLAVGANRKRLIADSTAPAGLAWAGAPDFRHVGTVPFELWHTAATQNPLGSITPGGDELTVIQFPVRRGGTLDRIACNVTVAGSAGRKGRIGIYKATSDTNVYPDALVIDAGEASVDTVGVKTFTISQALDPDTLYWLAYHSDSGAGQPTLRSHAVVFDVLGYDANLGTDGLKYINKVRTYSALPNPFPAGGVLLPFNVPAVFVRYSA